jgi:hypothetical protein
VNKGDRKGCVEKWLGDFELIMFKTMKDQIVESMADEIPRIDWIMKWLGQVVLTVDQI